MKKYFCFKLWNDGEIDVRPDTIIYGNTFINVVGKFFESIDEFEGVLKSVLLNGERRVYLNDWFGSNDKILSDDELWDGVKIDEFAIDDVYITYSIHEEYELVLVDVCSDRLKDVMRERGSYNGICGDYYDDLIKELLKNNIPTKLYIKQ